MCLLNAEVGTYSTISTYMHGLCILFALMFIVSECVRDIYEYLNIYTYYGSSMLEQINRIISPNVYMLEL